MTAGLIRGRAMHLRVLVIVEDETGAELRRHEGVYCTFEPVRWQATTDRSRVTCQNCLRRMEAS